jgi:hypothetical protein
MVWLGFGALAVMCAAALFLPYLFFKRRLET